MFVDPLQIWIMFAIWLVLIVFKRIAFKHGDFEIFLFLSVLALHLAVRVFAWTTIEAVTLDSLIFGGFAVSLLLFNPGELVGGDRTLQELKRLKKETKQMTNSYDSLRKRFIATIALSKDGLLFISDDGHIFGTDTMKTLIGFQNNEFTQEVYEKHIHSEDLSSYLDMHQKLKKNAPDFTMNYRFKKGDKYVWLKERGTLIYYENRTMVISSVQSIDVKMYPETEVDVLNELRLDQEFMEAIQSHNRNKAPYHLVFVELNNIPSINQKYGRDIGDLMMGEFLNKLKYNFVKDKQSLFRLSGIRYAVIIKDERKYEILERALKHGGDLLNFTMSFGNVNQSVFPYFGIQKIQAFDEPIDEIVVRTEKALDIALSEDNQDNYFIVD